jgi:hypothetical protein
MPCFRQYAGDRWQSVTAWMLQDIGEAKVPPEDLGIAPIE